jgi:hypothetical protein
MPKEQAVAPAATRTLLFPLLCIWDLMNATVPELTKTPPPLLKAVFPLIEEDVIVTVPEET